jgi:uncharacterized membrane protein YgcG
MMTRRWLIAIPLAAILVGSTAWGSAVRDEGRMFSPRAVEEAQRRLERLEQKTHIPVVIETVDHIPNLEGMSEAEKREALTRLAVQRDEKIRDPGMYILLSKRDRLISEPLIREHLKDVVPLEKRHAIRKAFIEEFGKKDFDGGLLRGVAEVERTLEGVSAPNHRAGTRVVAPVPVGQGARRGPVGGGGSMLSTFLLIGLGIFAVLIVLRLLGGLFGRSQGAGYPNQMGMGGPRPGMGPGGPGYGYGGGGYGGGGGRGGGFFSGLLGGLGGAMAGNWLYDQMSGRHGGMTSAGTGLPGGEASASPTDPADERIIGADDDGGQAASWDNGGADTGGGDWGGGDAGGDWGGGGGGGGDWGGGDGGGDWGGGGGGGGDW